MLSDVVSALRSLRRAPGFVLAAVLCLGLGLGANTTVYSLMRAVLLRPLPYARPAELVRVSLAKPATGIDGGALSVPYLLDLRESARTLSGLAGFRTRLMSLARGDGAEAVTAVQITDDYFTVVGVRPALGRAFRTDESVPGAPAVALLSDETWRAHFAADPRVVGQRVTLDGVPTTVVGVMPPSIGITGDREALWTPLPYDRDVAARANPSLTAIGRLRPGVTREAATRELGAIATRIGALHAGDADWVPRAVALTGTLVPEEVRPVFGAMMGAVGFVLLIACASVANLLLARTAARRRELAVRLALGAGRARVVRLLVTESLLVALAGGALGVGIANASTELLRRTTRVAYPSWIVFAVDRNVVGYAVALSLATGLVFGLLPAVRASRPQLAPALRDGGRGTSVGARRLREGLVTGALALALVLLVGAGVMIRDVLRLSTIDPGFTTRGVLVARLYLPGERFASTTRRLATMDAALARVRAMPGVAHASVMTRAPLDGGERTSTVYVEGRDDAAVEQSVSWLPTSGGSLTTLRVPLVAGRDLTEAEGRDTLATAVVVNETLARRAWPTTSAVGRRLALRADSARRWLTVVGVARDVGLSRAGGRPASQLWLPWATAPSRTMSLLIATRGETSVAASLAPALRRAVTEVDRVLPIASLQTLDGIASDALWRFRLYATLFGAFAGVALVLAVVGVYGVVAYQVAQRTRELGVRVALGARPRDVERLVLGDGARMAGVGVALGLALASGLTRLLSAALHGVSATDPLVFGGVTVALSATVVFACWLPARRATRVDPMRALVGE